MYKSILQEVMNGPCGQPDAGMSAIQTSQGICAVNPTYRSVRTDPSEWRRALLNSKTGFRQDLIDSDITPAGGGVATVTFTGPTRTTDQQFYPGLEVFGAIIGIGVPRNATPDLSVITADWAGRRDTGDMDCANAFTMEYGPNQDGPAYYRGVLLPGYNFQGDRQFTPAYIGQAGDVTTPYPAQSATFTLTAPQGGISLIVYLITAGSNLSYTLKGLRCPGAEAQAGA